MDRYTVTVYGAEEKCASCVHLPSAKEMFEWLEAAITRKFPSHHFTFQYIDIDDENHDTEHEKYVQAILQDEYFYPLVTIEGEVVAEGNPNLKDIFAKIEDLGTKGKK